MVMHKDAEGEHLDILQRLYPNLHKVDFLMVGDYIDRTSSHYWNVKDGRRMGCTNKCVLAHRNHGRFCFRRMITQHPGFFHRLKSISLDYAAYVPRINGDEDQIPEDESEEFHDEFSKDNPDSNQDWLIKLLDIEWSHPNVFVKLVECLSHAPKLSHLKLYNMDKVLRNQFLFLQFLSQNIKHVTITLNLNLGSFGNCYNYNGSSVPLTDREIEICRATLLTADDYLFALNETLRQRKRIFHLSDDESGWPVRALKFMGDSEFLFDPAHAAWLKQAFDWKPPFDWSSMVHLEAQS